MGLLGIFSAGLLTFVTPCVLPLILLYLSLLLGGVGQTPSAGGNRRLSLFISTLFFSLGMILVFVSLGLTATAIGRLLTGYRLELVLVGGLLIFLFGLKLLGVLHLPWLEHERRLDGRKLSTRFHHLNALILGLVFSLGWTPCVGPILGSVLTYTASAAASPLQGALYLGTYAAGFILPLLVFSLFADQARHLIGSASRWLPRVEKVTGALLVAVGLFLVLSSSRPPAATIDLSGPSGAVEATRRTPLGQSSTRPRLVQFTSPSCSICRQMIPTVALIEQECGGKQVDVVKIDVTEPQNRLLASAYGVRGVPTFVFLDRDGSAVARLVGHQTVGALQQALSALVGERCAGLGQFTPQPRPPAAPARGKSCSTTTAPQCGT